MKLKVALYSSWRCNHWTGPTALAQQLLGRNLPIMQHFIIRSRVYSTSYRLIKAWGKFLNSSTLPGLTLLGMYNTYKPFAACMHRSLVITDMKRCIYKLYMSMYCMVNLNGIQNMDSYILCEATIYAPLYSTTHTYYLYVNTQKMSIYRVQENYSNSKKSVQNLMCKIFYKYTLCRS